MAQIEKNFHFTEEVLEIKQDNIDSMIDDFTRLTTSQRRGVSCPFLESI